MKKIMIGGIFILILALLVVAGCGQTLSKSTEASIFKVSWRGTPDEVKTVEVNVKTPLDSISACEVAKAICSGENYSCESNREDSQTWRVSLIDSSRGYPTGCDVIIDEYNLIANYDVLG